MVRTLLFVALAAASACATPASDGYRSSYSFGPYPTDAEQPAVEAPRERRGPRCKKGIPCGNSCIAANKTCRVGRGSAYKAR